MKLRPTGVVLLALCAVLGAGCGGGASSEERAAADPLDAEREANYWASPRRFAIVGAGERPVRFRIVPATLGLPQNLPPALGRPVTPAVLVLAGGDTMQLVAAQPPRWIELATPVEIVVPGLISSVELAVVDSADALVLRPAGEGDAPAAGAAVASDSAWTGRHLVLRRRSGRLLVEPGSPELVDGSR